MNSRHKRRKFYSILNKYDDKLIRNYLEYGPDGLRRKLDVKSDELWEIIFDYLVFEKEVVRYCVRNNSVYIHDLFVEHGPVAIKKAFSLMNDKYEDEKIYQGKSSYIRKDLCIEKNKYEHVWGEVLDILLNVVATQAFTYSAFEHGISLFSKLYNQGRVQRSLRSLQL